VIEFLRLESLKGKRCCRQVKFYRGVCALTAQRFCLSRILVIDDGSHSSQVCPVELVEDERVRLIRHPTNLGVSAARNTGIRECRYSLIAFLDSDDWWLPEKLASQMSIYDKHRSKKNLLVYSSYYHEEDSIRVV
jgi:glycosyltransferase involved in cell wall biosynthesis